MVRVKYPEWVSLDEIIIEAPSISNIEVDKN